MHDQFLRIKKLKGADIIRIAAKHNHREIISENGVGKGSHIDPTRTHLNRVLRGAGSVVDTVSLSRELMSNAGVIKLRKDAVQALEILFSLPASSSIDQDTFFQEAIDWADQYFSVPVISAIVHNDECAPHCHVLLLPLLNGRMIGSDLVGNRSKLLAMQADFHARVAQKYGFRRPSPPVRISAAKRRLAAESIFSALSINPDLLTEPRVRPLLLEVFSKHPEQLIEALGLETPGLAPPKKSFVSIMTKPCKLEKPIGF